MATAPYTINMQQETLITATCMLVGGELHTGNQPYEVIIKDLCACMLHAIEVDDAQGKAVVGTALHMVLGSALSL